MTDALSIWSDPRFLEQLLVEGLSLVKFTLGTTFAS